MNEALVYALTRCLHGQTSRGATPDQVKFHEDHDLQEKFVQLYELHAELADLLRSYPGYSQATANEDEEAEDEAEVAIAQHLNWWRWGN